MKNMQIDKVRFTVYKDIMYRLVEFYKNAGFYVRNEPSYGFMIYINKHDYDNEFKPQIYDGAFIRITDLSLKIQRYSRLLDGCLNAFTGWKEFCAYDFNEETKNYCIKQIGSYIGDKTLNGYPDIYYKMIKRYNNLQQINKDFE